MKSAEYIPLNSWLANADMLYLDGRLLWFKQGIGGSCILLWLSLEQLLKTLVFQKRIEDGEFTSDEAKATFKKFDQWGINIGHNLKANLSVFNKCYPETLTPSDIKALEKIYEFFNRRYVVNTSAGIEIKLLYQVDSVYFKIRDLISKDLPMAFMDEIEAARNNQRPFTITEYTKYASLDNVSFRGRTSYRT